MFDPKLLCELCGGTGYVKSNTAEFEGDCPNGCANADEKALDAMVESDIEHSKHGV